MQKEKEQKNNGFTHTLTFKSEKKLVCGFSMLETIIYITIFSMIIGTIVSFSTSMTTSRLHNQMILEVNDQGRNAMKTITQTLRNASGVNSPTISNTASSLSVVTTSPSTTPTVFSESGGVLYITEGTDGAVRLTNNKVVISNLLFSNFSRPSTPNIIKISFKITSGTAGSSLGGSYSYTFNGSAGLRK